MKKVKLKHRESSYIPEGEGDKQMSERCLKSWIEDGIDEGLGAYNIQDALEEMFDISKIKMMLVESLTPQIMNAVSPYYKDEFYSSISRDKLIISPWWDDFWQEVKIVDIVKDSVDGWDAERLTETRNAFVESLAIIDKAIKENDES